MYSNSTTTTIVPGGFVVVEFSNYLKNPGLPVDFIRHIVIKRKNGKRVDRSRQKGVRRKKEKGPKLQI